MKYFQLYWHVPYHYKHASPPPLKDKYKIRVSQPSSSCLEIGIGENFEKFWGVPRVGVLKRWDIEKISTRGEGVNQNTAYLLEFQWLISVLDNFFSCSGMPYYVVVSVSECVCVCLLNARFMVAISYLYRMFTLLSVSVVSKGSTVSKTIFSHISYFAISVSAVLFRMM